MKRISDRVVENLLWTAFIAAIMFFVLTVYHARTTADKPLECPCPVYYGPDDVVLTEQQVRVIVETAFAHPTAQDSIVLSEANVPGYERAVPDGTLIVPVNDQKLNK